MSDEGCVVDGTHGFCEENGFCSFSDDACASGRRYGRKASIDIARTCVPFEEPIGTTDRRPEITGIPPQDEGSTGLPDDENSSSESSSGRDESTASTASRGEDSSSSTGGDDQPTANYAFVSSQPLTPSPTMLEDADGLCNELALAAGLPGDFVAWMSGDGVDAHDRLQQDGVLARGWVLPDGRPFADSVVDLTTGEIFYPLSLDEFGRDVSDELVVTGTLGQGTRGNTCHGWQDLSETNLYQAGRSGDTFERWTRAQVVSCTQPARVYCMGIDRDQEVGVEPQPGRLAFISDVIPQPSIGVEGLDAVCQSNAEAAGHEGSFLALVATPSTAPLDRFVDDDDWVNPHGVRLTTPGVGLADSVNLQTAIGYDASGSAISERTWGGSTSAYLASSQYSCQGWTSDASTHQVRIQLSSSPNDWYGRGLWNCGDPGRVICLEE